MLSHFNRRGSPRPIGICPRLPRFALVCIGKTGSPPGFRPGGRILDQPCATMDSMTVVCHDILHGTKLYTPVAEPHAVTQTDTTKGQAFKPLRTPGLGGQAPANPQQ
jgi:hypothetical protein